MLPTYVGWSSEPSETLPTYVGWLSEPSETLPTYVGWPSTVVERGYVKIEMYNQNAMSS